MSCLLFNPRVEPARGRAAGPQYAYAKLLAPFASPADLIGEPQSMLVARLCWIALGGVNGVLCAVVLAPLGRLAAALTGLMYALFFGTIYAEHTVLLEPPATAMLLLALVITRAVGSGDGLGTPHYVAAGLLLGLSPALKIWGVLTVLVVVGGIAYRRGLRPGLTVLISAVASCTVICLPLFLAAPGRMWTMVAADQVGRRHDGLDEARRIDGMLGLSLWTSQPRVHLGTGPKIGRVGPYAIREPQPSPGPVKIGSELIAHSW